MKTRLNHLCSFVIHYYLFGLFFYPSNLLFSCFLPVDQSAIFYLAKVTKQLLLFSFNLQLSRFLPGNTNVIIGYLSVIPLHHCTPSTCSQYVELSALISF